MIGLGIRRIGNQRKKRNHTDYAIVEIGQNTEKRFLET